MEECNKEIINRISIRLYKIESELLQKENENKLLKENIIDLQNQLSEKSKLLSESKQWTYDVVSESNNEIIKLKKIIFTGSESVELKELIKQEESKVKSERVKNSVVKVEGKKTVSYKGKKWGRKEIPEDIKITVIQLSNSGLSLRKIASKLSISKSVVHNIIHKHLLKTQ